MPFLGQSFVHDLTSDCTVTVMQTVVKRLGLVASECSKKLLQFLHRILIAWTYGVQPVKKVLLNVWEILASSERWSLLLLTTRAALKCLKRKGLVLLLLCCNPLSSAIELGWFLAVVVNLLVLPKKERTTVL